MVLGIYIVSDAGELIQSLKLETFDVNDTLFGGIVPALDMFSSTVSGQSIKTIQLDENLIFIHKYEKYYFVTVHSKDDSNAQKNSDILFQTFCESAKFGVTQKLIDELEQVAGSLSSGWTKAEKWARKLL